MSKEQNKSAATKECRVVKILSNRDQNSYVLNNNTEAWECDWSHPAYYHVDPTDKQHIITKDTFKPNPKFCWKILASTDTKLGLPLIPNDYQKDTLTIVYEPIKWDMNTNPSLVGQLAIKVDHENLVVSHTPQSSLFSLEAENKALREALTIIANPLKFLQERARYENYTLNGVNASKIANSAEYLKSIAEQALKQKP